MVLRRDSAVGRQFFSLVASGVGRKTAARMVGVGRELAHHWLGEEYVALRRLGLEPDEVCRRLGYRGDLVSRWECRVFDEGADRHHLRVDETLEARFWSLFDSGVSADRAAGAVGVSRSTGFRWIERRFGELRAGGDSVKRARRELRLSDSTADRMEQRRRERSSALAREEGLAQRAAVRVAIVAAQAAAGRRVPARRRVEARYWELMRAGYSNAAACRELGIHRKDGTRLRAEARLRWPSATSLNQLARPAMESGRYLQLHERLLIADLLRAGCSMRRIAAELGRQPSTIKRELDRHRDPRTGRYAPRLADHRAAEQRRRPRPSKLARSPELREAVQDKLDRLWSPDQICGWLRDHHGQDTTMRLCPESVYRALLVPGGQGLDRRLTRRLRSGRAMRKARHLDRRGGPGVLNKIMIDERPDVVGANTEAGHWEGDLILGKGCTSAMITLRERRTHYGIVINLPIDHTAPSTNAAIIKAMTGLPAQMKQTLTWDQGQEMARHQELAAATGMKVYFAEAGKPWQRGANENFNGLLRQYFPKGTDLSVHDDQHVAWVMNELNTRPRKSLGYQTPHDLFHTEIDQATTPPIGSQTQETKATRCVDA